ncbi:LacI family transcriptional regulator [Devosia pacifica]|nr:LacI family transcriptional regulator [Devosia pacifica]
MSKQQRSREAVGGDKTRPTLKTISELTGLSQSTVSLSLRGGANLKQETRDRVAEAAAQLGYVPDRAGVRLRTGKTNVVVLVLDESDNSIDFERHLIQGIGQAIRGTRYHLSVAPEFHRDGSVETIRYILDNKTADGVVITHTSAHDPRVALLMERQFPFVTHGRTQFFTPHPYYDFDSRRFTKLAVERLAEKGCRKVALLVANDGTTNHHNIVSAFEDQARKLGLEAEIHGRGPDPSADETRRLGYEMALSGELADGFICDSERRTMALLSGLRQGGAELGRDVQMVAKQTSDILPTLFPQIDTIEEDVSRGGIEIANLLISAIGGEDATKLQVLGEPVVHWRSG